MTLQEAIDITDEMKPNMMKRGLKYKYLTEIEQVIYEEIVMKHYDSNNPTPPQPAPSQDPLWYGWRDVPLYPEDAEPEPEKVKPVYSEETDPGTELIVPDPYSMLYVYWLMSKIDIQNQEDARYNIDRTHFENAYEQMADWWTREHMPIQNTREFRL